ncbi:OmpH family outer membrane protein [Candidatus Calescamantes bacterium]|nr:OmpH family outer membrane protein [bacterium]MCK5224276.1 OmpH family outer membrane protein [Candidatus Calescamantes bacterium]MCK5398610.1 OmpH family outer membrane protein [bacterium]MCK5599015.1 OmpH family outer membrane protein [bacterium]
MKKTLTLFIVMLTGLMAFASEIAYVDAMEVFQNVDQFKAEFEKLSNYFQSKQVEIDTKKSQIEGELSALQDQSELMDKTKREQKTNELKTKYEALVKDFQAAQQELNQKQQMIYETFQAQLAVAVQKVADKLGYDMVVLKEAVIYAGSGNDITSDVIREMNGRKPAKKKSK